MKSDKRGSEKKPVGISRSTATGTRLELLPRRSSGISVSRSITFDFLLTTEWCYLLRINGKRDSDFCGAFPISLEEFLAFETLYGPQFQMDAVIRVRATRRKDGRYLYSKLEEDFGSVRYDPAWPGGETVEVLLGNIFPTDWDGKRFEFENLGVVERLVKERGARGR